MHAFFLIIYRLRKLNAFQMLCTALFVEKFPSPLGYIPCWTTILSSFIESIGTDTARIVPINNHISVFIPASEAERKAEFMDATMQTSLGLLSSLSSDNSQIYSFKMSLIEFRNATQHVNDSSSVA